MSYSQTIEEYKKSLNDNDNQYTYTIHLPIKIKSEKSIICNIDVVKQMTFSNVSILKQVKSDFIKIRKTFQKGCMSLTRNVKFSVYNTYNFFQMIY